jgi:hypothetical protein
MERLDSLSRGLGGARRLSFFALDHRRDKIEPRLLCMSYHVRLLCMSYHVPFPCSKPITAADLIRRGPDSTVFLPFGRRD